MSKHCAALTAFWLSGSGHRDFILRSVISCVDLFTLGVFWVSRSEDWLTNTWGTQSSSLREPLGAEGWTPTSDRQAYRFQLQWEVIGENTHLWVRCLEGGFCKRMCVCLRESHSRCAAQTMMLWWFLKWGCFLEEEKNGAFRGGVDECVDGGILIGVILTWQGPGSLMNQNVSGRRWRWRAAHCGSDTHVRGRGCWGSSVTPH